MVTRILVGDALEHLQSMPEESVHCCVTSPPYFRLRDYEIDGQVGLEETPSEFVATLVSVFREVRRVLRSDGTLWLNLGDSYAGSWGAQDKRESPNEISRNSIRNHPKLASKTGSIREVGLKPKDLIGIPWRVAFALREDGWFLRQDIIWHKPNPMPESVTDRCTKAHEYVFLMSKEARYYFDAMAIRDPAAYPEGPGNRRSYNVPGQRSGQNAKIGGGVHKIGPKETRNRRSIWTVATKPFKQAHFATYPEKLVEPCILAGCPAGGTVLDPFFGAGTTGLVATRLGRDCIGIELNPEYAEIARTRLRASLARVQSDMPERKPSGGLFGEPEAAE